MESRAQVTAQLMTIGAALAAGLLAGSPARAADESAYDRCSAIANAERRLACFDEVQKARGRAPAHEAVQTEHRRSFGLKVPSIAAPRLGSGEDQSVTVRVAAVGQTHDGKLWIRTEDGAVWDENDTVIVRQPPKVGDSVRIRRAAVGSYLCDFTRWQSVRCERRESQ